MQAIPQLDSSQVTTSCVRLTIKLSHKDSLTIVFLLLGFSGLKAHCCPPLQPDVGCIQDLGVFHYLLHLPCWDTYTQRPEEDIGVLDGSSLYSLEIGVGVHYFSTRLATWKIHHFPVSTHLVNGVTGTCGHAQPLVVTRAPSSGPLFCTSVLLPTEHLPNPLPIIS